MAPCFQEEVRVRSSCEEEAVLVQAGNQVQPRVRRQDCAYQESVGESLDWVYGSCPGWEGPSPGSWTIEMASY